MKYTIDEKDIYFLKASLDMIKSKVDPMFYSGADAMLTIILERIKTEQTERSE